MEPTTFILLFSIPALLAGVALVLTHKSKVKSHLVEEARRRAKQREYEKAFADTDSIADPYRAGLEFSTSRFDANDLYDTASAPLSSEQINTINSIFDGYKPEPKHRPTNTIGAGVTRASGVPMSLTAFNEYNKIVPVAEVEYLDSGFVWPETHKHQ
jgi:hypothetical protein